MNKKQNNINSSVKLFVRISSNALTNAWILLMCFCVYWCNILVLYQFSAGKKQYNNEYTTAVSATTVNYIDEYIFRKVCKNCGFANIKLSFNFVLYQTGQG